MSSSISLSEFAQRVRELARRPVTTRDELDHWQAAARDLEASISGELSDRVPHFVWHFLADADIRFHEADYRHEQEQQLEAALKDFEDAVRV